MLDEAHVRREGHVLGRRLGLAVLLALGGACGSGGSRDTSFAGVCSSPAATNTFGAATSVGCEPEPTFQICEVPSGATLNPDGTYTPPATCTNPCAPGGYALRCTAPAADGIPTAPIPAPDPGLRCEVLPLPTPSNVTFYCCACAGGG
jgi:hypothetical protein